MDIKKSSTLPGIENEADLARKREIGKTFLFCVMFFLLIFLIFNVSVYGDLFSFFLIIIIVITILLFYFYPKIHNSLKQKEFSEKSEELVKIEQEIYSFLVKNQGNTYRKEDIINLYLNNKYFDFDSKSIKEALSNLANSNKVSCIIVSGELSFLVEK